MGFLTDGRDQGRFEVASEILKWADQQLRKKKHKENAALQVVLFELKEKCQKIKDE